MPMKTSTIETRLKELDELLDRKAQGIGLSECYDRPSFFIHRLEWMYKFHHIDRKTFTKYIDRVSKVFEIDV